MSHSPRYRARIQLTTEQIASIRQQTGMAQVPAALDVAIEPPLDQAAIAHALDFDPGAEHGLIYERNRI